ncbi:stalk domain-containing protein [Paenibacillus sp. GCM10027626]|uniref:stalk domain-containing protein n=1 Tax=Paenibacillus sp. GCM10027626 TaxID=3273411 RepID=UPI003632F31F
MKKRLVVIVSAAALSVGLVAGAAAGPTLEKITASLNWGLKFKVDGKDWNAQDAKGTKLAPITYNNTTYLPVRAVSELVGTAVDYNSAAQTITIGEKTSSVPITKEKIDTGLSSQVMSTVDKQFTMQNGVDYKSGVVVNNINAAQKGFKLQPGGKYQKLELQFFGMEFEQEVEIKIFNADNVLLKMETLTVDKKNATVDLDIGALKEVKVELKGTPGGSGVVFTTGSYR